VILAAHRPELIALADRVLNLAPERPGFSAQSAGPGAGIRIVGVA